MKRLLPLAWLALAGTAVADAPPRQSLDLGLDIGYVHASGNPSWTEGSVGKLRYDDSNDGLVLDRAYADYRVRIADTVNARVAAEIYDDDIGPLADVTEAWLEWRPLTLSQNRYRLKVGAFYPRISMENGGPSWSSEYTLSSSAINTWIAEEVRVYGAELSVSRRPLSLGGAHTFLLQASVFWKNDPSGTLLAWKGWSLHDRQTRYGDELPLPWLPQIGADGRFRHQAAYSVPSTEVDDRPGWFAAAEWRYANRIMVRALHYNNRGDPKQVQNGQYGWGTAFDHIGVQAALPGRIGLVAQWLRGKTNMGFEYLNHYSVDVRYDSRFLLLTRLFDRHRVTVRYDDFNVRDIDGLPLDDSSESGHAWTLAYAYQLTEQLGIAAEWLDVHTFRPAWAYNGFAVARDERQLELSLRLRFGHAD